MAKNKITDEQIMEDILKVKEKAGKIPTQDSYKKYGSFSINSILNRKPWNAWLKELFGTTNVSLAVPKHLSQMLDQGLMSAVMSKSPSKHQLH